MSAEIFLVFFVRSKTFTLAHSCSKHETIIHPLNSDGVTSRTLCYYAHYTFSFMCPVPVHCAFHGQCDANNGVSMITIAIELGLCLPDLFRLSILILIFFSFLISILKCTMAWPFILNVEWHAAIVDTNAIGV